jgi:hypothetical protein
MRRLILAVFIFLLLFVCGCTQPVIPVPTPVPTLTPLPVMTAPMVVTPVASVTPYQMQINVTAWQKGTDVNVQYNGGADAAYLTALKIRIDNFNGQNVQRTIDYPTIGSPYIFTYIGTADADRVNVVGVFKGGTEQTVLLTYL